jgi:hypothetical protein
MRDQHNEAGHNFSNAPLDQGYAVVARHHAQSMVSPQNFRENMQQLHDQQRMQMHYMDQEAAYNSHSFQHNRKKPKKQNLEQQMVYENMDGSLGILRNVARLNRPDMGQLDREYRIKTEHLLKQQSRQGMYHYGEDGTSPGMRSTQKSSAFSTALKTNK